MSTQFIHVAQFLQTIICFSVLILIGQRFLMTWRSLDEKYIAQRVKQLEEQSQWEKQHMQAPSAKSAPGQQLNKQQEKIQPPKQEHLRSSLVSNQPNQTDRQISIDETQFEQKFSKRKSLTDLSKDQDQDVKQIQINDESKVGIQRKEQDKDVKQIQIKDQSQIGTQRKKSVDSKEGQQRNRQITNELDNTKFMDQSSRQPSITQNHYNRQQNLKIHPKYNHNLHIFTLIDNLFNQNLSILVPISILGILVHSTYIFIMTSLFAYLFTNLLLRYRNSLAQLRNQPSSSPLLSKLTPLLPKLWIIAIFISYWSDDQYA